ncbi:23S rRNA (uracil(1939)-C(5))-methyltransferase RlmD [soil metagenome]
MVWSWGLEGVVNRERGRRSNRRSPSAGRGGGAAPTAVLTIDSIAAGGEGVGRLEDGRVTFVHRTAPGDRVEVALTERRERWARGRLLKILEPSPVRRDPPCAFYLDCGGCTLEHMTYEAQLQAKARIVADALTRIGKIEVEPPVVIASPKQQRYRNRVSFALRRLGDGHVVAGFHALGNAERVVDVDGRCLLPEEPIARVWDLLREAWGADVRHLPAGERLRLTLRSSTDGEVMLLIEGGYSPGNPEELLRSVEGLTAIWHQPGGAGPELIAGAPGLPESWGDETVELTGTAFLQVNRAAAALLEQHVLGEIGEVVGLRVVDAYCGVGLHARRLARAGAEVIGIEMDAAAVAAATAAAPQGATFLEGAVEMILPGVLPADIVILNPPRAGLAAEVPETLRADPPHRVIYISCNPATLARDLQRLGAGFHLDTIHCFDLFPQTAHVETVVALRRT